jgi:uncharacterized metal-binding protein YceD (DUF177 family)
MNNVSFKLLPLPSNFYVMTNSSREYVIPFIGLKQGTHTFEFRVKDAFFEDLEYSFIHSGDVQIDLVLDKKETMLIGNFSAQGKVNTACDRCTAPVNVPVRGTFQLIYKFGTELSDDETLVMIHPDSYEIDVKNNIYELITVSLPLRCVHEEGECDPEMLDALNAYLLNPEEESDEDDDEDEDDDSEDDDDESYLDDDEDDNDGNDDDDIDPRWSILKNLN